MSHHIAHTRIPLIKNPKYKRSGLKSYVWLLGKCKSLSPVRRARLTRNVKTTSSPPKADRTSAPELFTLRASSALADSTIRPTRSATSTIRSMKEQAML